MKQVWFIKLLIFATTILFLTSLRHREVHVDDAWIGEQAYWMSELGYVKSELMRGITQQEIRNLVHHKLFTLNGALFIKVFGFSLYSLKAVSLVWYGIYIYLFHQFLNKEFKDKQLTIIGIFFIIIHSFMFEYAFVYRPEVMVMTLGFISFCFINNYIKLKDKSISKIFFSSLFAGLAAVSHLNGLIFIISGCLLLLYYKHIKDAFVYGVFCLLPLIIYFYDFNNLNDIHLWLYQFNHSPAILNESKSWIVNFISKILDEHKLFLHSPKEIIFTFLFLFMLFISRKELRKIDTTIVYLALLVISLAMISMHNTSKYTILYLPYMIIVIVFGTDIIAKNKDQLTNFKIYNILILSFIIIHTYYNIKTSSKKHYPQNLRELSISLFGANSNKLNIIAPMQYVFNEIQYYKRIQSDLGYMDRVRFGEINNVSEFLCEAVKYQIDYIIIDKTFAKFMQIEKSTTEINNSDFHIWRNTSEYLILKCKN